MIDLTDTYRYYNPEEWAKEGIEYVKLRCHGHSVHEQLDAVKAFFAAVTEFLRRNSQTGSNFNENTFLHAWYRVFLSRVSIAIYLLRHFISV